MLKSELIKEDNLEVAVEIQNIIFPHENGRRNFVDSILEHNNTKVDNHLLTSYYLIKKEDKYIGIWGHYTLNKKDEAWLGWFGVLPEYRNKGYGKEIFKLFENFAKENAFNTIRLYTDEIDNAIACVLYTKMGMTKEYYNNPNDVNFLVGPVVIFSKSLNNKKLVKWNSRFIDLKTQEEKQNNIIKLI